MFDISVERGGGSHRATPIIPVSQFMLCQPLLEDIGHLHDVGEVMQKHMVL